jgi:hypothetical protein
MKKRWFLSVICSFLLMMGMSMFFSACSNSSDDDINGSKPPRIISLKYGDYLKDVSDISATAHKDDTHITWYFDDAKNNTRYYVYPADVHEADKLDSLLSEGDKVRFEGKLYGFNKEWMARDSTLTTLQKTIQQYVIVAPKYVIEKN